MPRVVALFLFALATLYWCAPAGAQLVGQWPLDAISGGQVADASGQGHPGSAVGTLTVVVSKRLNGVRMGAAGDAINFGNDAALCPPRLTLTCWVRFDSLAGDQLLVQRYTWQQSGFYIKYDQAGNDLYGEIFDGSASPRRTVSFAGTPVGTALETGTLYHLALTHDGTQLRAYLNGRLVQSIAAGPIVLNTGSLTIGPGASGMTFDEMRLYNEALPATAIQSIYDEERRNYAFNGSITRDVLESYLSRAVTHQGLLAGAPEAAPTAARFSEDLRMLNGIGAKLIGRAAYTWGVAPSEEDFFTQVAARATQAHALDSEMLLQACIFECVSTGVNSIPVPAWAFQELGRPVEARTFDYAAMIFTDGRWVDQWGEGASVPDMTRPETQLWFYYRARRFIDAGCESIHFGQVHLMGANDSGFAAWAELLADVRAYAATHARRGLLLCDAHTHGIARSGQLLFDYHSFPMRPQEVEGSPYHAVLQANVADSIYGKSLDGTTPSGWSTEGRGLPYLVEFDNFGATPTPGESDQAGSYVWGWDEITWFTKLGQAERMHWLRYVNTWLAQNTASGFFQPSTRRVLAESWNDLWMFCGNATSAAAPDGQQIEPMLRGLFQRTDYNPLQASSQVEHFNALADATLTRQSDDTLQQALAQGQVTLTCSSRAFGAADRIADYQAAAQPGTTMAYPADSATDALTTGSLDIRFNPQYSGGRALHDLTLWIAPTNDARRYYDFEFYASSTADPMLFTMIYATRNQGEAGLLAGQGTALKIEFPTEELRAIDTLRIVARVSGVPNDEANGTWFFATVIDELDINLVPFEMSPLGSTLTRTLRTTINVPPVDVTDTLQVALGQGRASIVAPASTLGPPSALADAGSVSSVGSALTFPWDSKLGYVDAIDLVFPPAYTGPRSLDWLRVFVQSNDTQRRFYDFDLWFSRQSAPSHFIRMASFREQDAGTLPYVPSVRSIVLEVRGENHVHDIHTVRIKARPSDEFESAAYPWRDGTAFQEVDLNLTTDSTTAVQMHWFALE